MVKIALKSTNMCPLASDDTAQTDTQIERQTDRQTDRQRERQIHRQREREREVDLAAVA